ncbi:hypothetical protein ABT063_48700 [Streptomyces sp. NPDC002838]|uniref:hypothetical protein n=1 Tax=Streptomyces sp. NPDC002838 TaxID=3154436 RepID=UPI003323F67F
MPADRIEAWREAAAIFRGAVINAIRAAGYRSIPEGRLDHVTAIAALHVHGFLRQARHPARPRSPPVQSGTRAGGIPGGPVSGP